MSKRYFINNHDSIIGQQILKELTKEETEDPVHMVTYMDHSKRDRPKGVKKVLNRHSKPKLMRKKMLEECDVYIYDLHFGDLDDVLFGGNILDKATLEEQKTLILISDVMVWNQTPKKIKEKVAVVPEEGEEGEKAEQEKPQEEEQQEEQNENSQAGSDNNSQQAEDIDNQKLEDEVQQEEEPVEYTSYNEADYKKRKCSEKYKKMKIMEDLMLRLNKENLKVIVVCSGILYGLGELAFRNHFKAAWLQNPSALPYVGEGQNLIPTIHISDLAKFVIKVAENPPENNYLFAIDNTKDRRQKVIIQSISDGVGSKQIIQDDSTSLIDENTIDIFNLDVDMTPSPLLVGDEENPVEFDWTCEKGLTDPINNAKVLQEFQREHKLRPIKVIMFTPENERQDLRFDQCVEEISQHYRIPVIKIREVIEWVKENISKEQDILGEDLREEYAKIIEYLDSKQPRKLDETLKVLYRVIRWRLSQNDCFNRGYILDNYPLFGEEAGFIFYPQKKKLDRVRPKPKKIKKAKKQDDEDNQAQEQQEQQKKVDEEKSQGDQENEDEEEGEGDEEQDENNNQQVLPKEEQPEAEEEEEEEEEQPPEDEEQPPEEEEEEEDPDNPKPKVEPYHPESIIFIKRIVQNREIVLNNSKCEIIDYFSKNDVEAYITDTTGKTLFEAFESQRIYIERQGRPYNYLVDESELVKKHQGYYDDVNKRNEENKLKKKEEEQKVVLKQKQDREDLAQEQINYIIKNELEIDKIKNLPFRNYLMEYIVPELNEGLLEVSNMLPDDPIEFLAEYLYSKSYE
ncbi:hypothetical protein ABPG72_004899 [Tetrahymena utriculariae]